MAQTQSRHIRVFISSTFRDMQAERDYLVKFIFPQLRKLCDQRGVTWGEVDLRWGITDEQTAEGQVLPLCMAEIERCRPFFIGLLGERYGWVPDTIQPDLIAREPWLAEHAHHSVTELEILHGVLNNPAMTKRVFFYFRDPAFVQSLTDAQLPDFTEIPTPKEINQYGQSDAQQRAEERKRKLQVLKERIRTSSLPLRENFRDPQELGAWVLADMIAVIDQLFPPGSEPDLLQQEAELHQTFARSRSHVYIGGEEYFRQLNDHLRHSRLPLVVVGDSGSGKSALLANWALRYQAQHPDELTLMHFIGASPASTDWAAMLRRIMAELKQRFAIEEEIPMDDRQLSAAFPNWLYRASVKGKVLLVLDALNQLEDRQGARELYWLPNELPENVHLILSTLPCAALDAALEKQWPTLSVQPLSLPQRLALTRIFLAQYAKKLSSDREERIVLDPQSANPLGLRLLLDELRQFGSHERLDEALDRYLGADSIPSLFDLVLQRCEQDYEGERPGLVREALSLIWAARRGLSETELLDLLGSGTAPLPQRVWAPLALALENALFDRGGLLNFFHDFIRQAVEHRYLPTQAEQQQAHLRFARYFEDLEDSPRRRLEELPWQLQQAEEWQRLYDLLADLIFFEVLFEHNEFELLSYWAAVEAYSGLKRTDAYKVAVARGLPLHLLNWLAINFQNSGFLGEALELFKEQERICRQLNDPDRLAASLGDQALILKAWGRLEEAMELHKEEERICRQLNDPNGLSASLGNQANILYAWGRLEEAMGLHKEEERICRQLNDPNGLQACLSNQANILSDWGRLEEAMELLKETERICRQLNNPDGLHRSLGNQALILSDWGRLEEAMELHKEQEGICRQLNNPDGLQASLGNQALILKAWGRLEEAMELHKEQEGICRQLNDPNGLSASLGNQALILYAWGRLEEAMELHKEEERICREMNNPDGLQRSLGNQALILYAWGRLEEAMELHKEEERICREMNNPGGLQRSLGNQAHILYSWDRLEEAMELLKEQERICRQMNNPDGLQASLGNQAHFLYAWGRLEEAMELLKEQERICRQMNNPDGLQASLGNQALILKAWSKLEEAMELLKEQERICRQIGNINDLCISLVNQGAIYGKKGDREKHSALVREALSIAREHKLIRLAEQIEAILKDIDPGEPPPMPVNGG